MRDYATVPAVSRIEVREHDGRGPKRFTVHKILVTGGEVQLADYQTRDDAAFVRNLWTAHYGLAVPA